MDLKISSDTFPQRYLGKIRLRVIVWTDVVLENFSTMSQIPSEVYRYGYFTGHAHAEKMEKKRSLEKMEKKLQTDVCSWEFCRILQTDV